MDLDEIEQPNKPDYHRANGSPMVLVEGKRERFSRTSGYAKPLDDESALTNWRIDTACFGVAGDKALQARYVSTKRDDRSSIKDLREAAIQAGRGSEAADIGTAIHAMTERAEDPDDGFDPPEPYKSSLDAYVGELDKAGLKSVYFEVPLVTVEYRCAGTADRIYELTMPMVVPTGEILPVGTLVIGDIKTSKSLDYSKGAFATQLSLYAQGQRYDVLNDEFLPTPDINQDWGIIAWIPSNQEGHCELLWIDLLAGNEAAWLAYQVKEYRRKWRGTSLVPAQTHVSKEEAVVELLEEELGAEKISLDTDECIAYISSRITLIRDNPQATQLLLRKWPKGVPTPKKGLSDMEDIEKVFDLLDKVEAEYGFSFDPSDPRIVAGAASSRAARGTSVGGRKS